MKLFICCLLLLPLATVVLTAPIRARTENVLSFRHDALGTVTVPATVTAYRTSPSKPVTEKDSGVKDPESHEIMMPKVVATDNAQSGGETGADKDSAGRADTSRRLAQGHWNKEPTDPDSEEGTTVAAREASQGAKLQRKARRVNGLREREMLDWDSLEDNNGRLAAVGNDYDETREYVSSEVYPIAPPAHKPSSVPAKSRASW